MVRFSCFNPHAPSPKSKKALQTSIEAMQKVSNESSYILATKAPLKTRSLTSLFVKAQGNAQAIDNGKDITSPLSVERCWKSEEISGKLNITSDKCMHQTTVLKKSQSLGSGLCHKGQVLSDEDETDQGYSGDSDQSVLVGPDSSRDQVVSPTSHQQRAPQSDTVNEGSGLVNNESIFSIGDPRHSGKESPENSETLLSGGGANESGNHTSCAAQRMVKSYSLPEVVSSPVGFGRYLSQSRSCEDLQILDMRLKDTSNHKGQKQVVQEEVEDDNMCKAEIKDYANSLNDVYDFCGYSALAKDWVVPAMFEVNLENNFHEDSSNQQLCELPSKDFKSKRIEQWVNDLQHCSMFEETNELLSTDDPPKQSSSVLNDGWSAANVDEKATPGMEAAKRYISSLSASATTAQLSNYGLAVIPFLSAFVGLKVLNLSGNAIVKITAGTLPRGLHALNLSKNKISAIEGLRELTRLRVLDLSYNRILRIGHGLASCSSLKELYLAGNKISEVEGLHRLLKLTVLDLCFNKISTAKCLGQLAANYNSLQAINLEGNPAQKNVGDEQLKKHLLGLLPHLVYFNRQAIKVSSLKDSADRAVRLGINAHQFDRGLRSDNKTVRKANRGASGPRPSSSSTHGRRNQAVVSPKRSKAKHVHFPPSGNKVSINQHHQFDVGSKFLNFRSELSMRRSRSEGTLGAL